MRRATGADVARAEHMIDAVETRRREDGPFSGGIDMLNSARLYLGTGPCKSPQIERAWLNAAQKYEATKALLLRDLAEGLALPPNWRSVVTTAPTLEK